MILVNSDLKCYRRIQCHKLTKGHREARIEKVKAFISCLAENGEWKHIGSLMKHISVFMSL